VFGAIIEAEGGDHLFGGDHVMQSGDRIEATGKKNNDFQGKKGL
jgi:hypothetical protein